MATAPDNQPLCALSNPSQTLGPRKRKRNARACDRCHKNASKCSPGEEGSTCMRCTENGVRCTYTRPFKRRGPPPLRQARALSDAQPPTDQLSSERRAGSNGPSTPENGPSTGERALPLLAEDDVSAPFYIPYKEVLTPETIESLVDVFFHVGYPLRPYFHWPTYRAQIQAQGYRSDWGLFVVTMAVCSLAAGRLHDGITASPSGSFDPHPLRFQAVQLSSECYHAAVNAMPKDINQVTSEWYQFMKAKALLASACLQNGEIKKAVAHGGDYFSLSTSRGFHDESNWPEALTERERQERRRLFWGVYQHDQHMANSFSFLSRQREAKAAVQYPAEVYNDSDITESAIRYRPDKISFLRGWNFCTDLYRILEHMDGLIRPGRQIPTDEPGGQVTAFLSSRQPPKSFASDGLRLISQLYDDLPDDLKKVKSMTGDPQQDRYGFLASNILITTQTLKMVLVGSEKPSVHMRCAIATELLDELSAIPLAFFHVSSTVTLHHLAQVGHMLAGVIQHPVSAWTYLQVRNILLVLAEFLTKIESRLSTPGLAEKLRGQISRIDQCMQQLSQQNPEPGLLSIGRTLLSNNTSINSLGSLDSSDEQQLENHVYAGNRPMGPELLHQNHTTSTAAAQTYLHRPESWTEQQPSPGRSSPAHNAPSQSHPTAKDPTKSQQPAPAPAPASGNIFDFMYPISAQAPSSSFNNDETIFNSNENASANAHPGQFVLPSDLLDTWPFSLGQTVDTYEPLLDVFQFSGSAGGGTRQSGGSAGNIMPNGTR